jgi:DNA polymerase-3 subunit epsilon
MSPRSVRITFDEKPRPGFAVISVVTTGFMPETHDRVLELAVVLLSPSGTPQGEWVTLINPQRDPGAVHLHGVPSRELIGAPTFDDIAPMLLESIEGRTVVAHNAGFGMRFVQHELDRAGFPMPVRPAALCTMKWAGKLIGPAKLEHCCNALDITLEHQHHALPAARSTGELLTHLLRHGRSIPDWQHDADSATSHMWPLAPEGRRAPALRSRGADDAGASSWMSAVLESTWIAGSPENEAAYMLALDSALLDRNISVTEGEHLIEVARQSGLGRDRIIELHRDYLVEMAKVALDDGVVTGDERDELERVADGLALGPAHVDQALSLAAEFRQSAKHAGAPGAFLARGDRVVFTGAMRRNRDSWIELIVQAGLASGGVTKSTRLLVTADPDSMSGKAGKARGFGVPVVDEEAFERMFAEYCASTATV